MEVYRSETREILTRYREDQISRPECIAALDSALLAAVPELDPADLRAVQGFLAENFRWLAEIDAQKQRSDVGAWAGQSEPVLGSSR